MLVQSSGNGRASKDLSIEAFFSTDDTIEADYWIESLKTMARKALDDLSFSLNQMASVQITAEHQRTCP